MLATQEKSRALDEDADLLEKYTRADESKIKELTLQLDKLTAASAKATRDLNAEAAETREQQIGLDKAADTFQRLHHEQQELTKMWEGVIQQMELRDGDIEREADKFSALQATITERVRLCFDP